MEMKGIASAQSIKAENKCYVVLKQAGIWNRKIHTFIAMLCAGTSIPKHQGPHKEILAYKTLSTIKTQHNRINRGLAADRAGMPAPYSPVWSKLSSSHRLVP